MTDPIGLKNGGGVVRNQTIVSPSGLAALNAYGRSHVDDFEDYASISPIGEGYSNPTYRVVTARGTSHVLRAMPSRRSSASAHRIDREYRVISALAQSAVPVPAAINFCKDAGILGTPFYLMEYIEGPVYSEGRLPPPATRRPLYLALAKYMGALHSADYRALGLADYAAHQGGNYFDRQIATMTRLYRDSEAERLGEMEELIATLQVTRPPLTSPCLIHGDFRLGNMVISPERCDIAAVLDWELSTLGDPLTDVAYCSLMYHWDSKVFGTVMGVLDVPTETEFLETYCRFTGRDGVPELGLYQAFSLFRLACITQAALHRQAAGHPLPRPVPPENRPAILARLALTLATRRKPFEE